MHRFLGLFFLLLGIVGGWVLGQPEEPVEEIPATLAWQYYLNTPSEPLRCLDDVPPHPALVAALLAVVPLGVMTIAARRDDKSTT